MPLISVITINYNNAPELEKTIVSVLEQKFSDYSFVVIDGGSIDGSVEVIKKYSDKITSWISEKDTGIYNAMNKGTKQAQGSYCYYLNSGDIFFDEDVLANASKHMAGKHQLIAGNVETVLKSGKKKIWKTKELYRVSEIAFGHLPHQGFFFHKSLFEIYGLYNEQLKIISDWEYLLKLIIANVSIKYSGITFATHFFDGISNELSNIKVLEEERASVLKNLATLFDDLTELHTGRNFFKYFFHRIKSSIKYRLNKTGDRNQLLF